MLQENIAIASYSEFRRLQVAQGAMMITSALAKEGKSFIALELAISKALRVGSDRPILLVDMNPLSQENSQLLVSEPGPGLIGALLEKEEIANCVLPTEVNQLFILPLGDMPGDFIPLVYLKKLKVFIAELAKSYLLILDAGPVFLRNRNNFDPAELGQMVGSVYLVVLSGKTPRELVAKSQADLESANANLAGVILNDRFVKPMRSEVADILSKLEKIPLVGNGVTYLRQKLGIF